METKYYTPSIDEFCIGFEYEYSLMGHRFVKENNTLVNRTEPVKHWIKGIVEDIDTLKMLEVNFINTDRLRVKYLDKVDIESLGFEEEDYSDLDIGKFTKVYATFGKNKDTKLYGATLFTGNIVDSTYIKIDGAISPGPIMGYLGRTIFKGNIKNKTELGKLLKQLNII
jgi:hypothetical protein